MRRTALLCSVFMMTCTAALSISAAARASEGDTPPRPHVQRVVHRHVIPVSAVALLPFATPAVRASGNADGMTRNADQCNTGCIDN
jgi:hypothetical protein